MQSGQLTDEVEPNMPTTDERAWHRCIIRAGLREYHRGSGTLCSITLGWGAYGIDAKTISVRRGQPEWQNITLWRCAYPHTDVRSRSGNSDAGQAGFAFEGLGAGDRKAIGRGESTRGAGEKAIRDPIIEHPMLMAIRNPNTAGREEACQPTFSSPTPADLFPFPLGQHRLGSNRRLVRDVVFAAFSSFRDGEGQGNIGRIDVLAS